MRTLGIAIGLSCILAAMPGLANDAIRKSPEHPAIGTLRENNLQPLPYICECEFFRGPINGATTVFATRKERTVAFVMVDGQPVTLQRDSKPNTASCRKNAGYHERWVGGATAVVLDYRATGSGAESCWFKGKMSVAIGRRIASTNISGACGC